MLRFIFYEIACYIFLILFLTCAPSLVGREEEIQHCSSGWTTIVSLFQMFLTYAVLPHKPYFILNLCFNDFTGDTGSSSSSNSAEVQELSERCTNLRKMNDELLGMLEKMYEEQAKK